MHSDYASFVILCAWYMFVFYFGFCFLAAYLLFSPRFVERHLNIWMFDKNNTRYARQIAKQRLESSNTIVSHWLHMWCLMPLASGTLANGPWPCTHIQLLIHITPINVLMPLLFISFLRDEASWLSLLTRRTKSKKLANTDTILSSVILVFWWIGKVYKSMSLERPNDRV